MRRMRKTKRIRRGLHLLGQVRPLRKVSLSLNNIELAAALFLDKKRDWNRAFISTLLDLEASSDEKVASLNQRFKLGKADFIARRMDVLVV